MTVGVNNDQYENARHLLPAHVRVRDTIDVCQPGGGWCLGTGNSVANYIPAANYLAMLDEGRK